MRRTLAGRAIPGTIPLCQTRVNLSNKNVRKTRSRELLKRVSKSRPRPSRAEECFRNSDLREGEGRRCDFVRKGSSIESDSDVISRALLNGRFRVVFERESSTWRPVFIHRLVFREDLVSIFYHFFFFSVALK